MRCKIPETPTDYDVNKTVDDVMIQNMIGPKNHNDPYDHYYDAFNIREKTWQQLRNLYKS